ncbi:MAG TPA: UpxY family transcription antiterminator [Prolixibacteraceae bacterium]|nr:UpxY family transcription antiterminator [Prolixibacteraceae bacterium]
MVPSNSKAWYAVYTKSRAEKKVQLEFDYQGIEAYLPLQRKLRQWSDRKKWVEVPLISGYIFVHISRKEYESVLKTQGVVSYVRFEGKPAVIPDEQIEWIKRMLRQSDIPVQLHRETFTVGDQIQVIAGPLIGIRGILITLKSKKRVAIQLEQLNVSLLVEIPINEIEKI